MMDNLSERDRRTLRLGGIGVGAILLVVLVGFPALDYWDALAGRLEKARGRLLTIQSDVRDAAKSSASLASLRDTATILTDPAELNQQTARMLQQVEGLPGYSSINVSRLEGLQQRDEERYHRSGVSLQFSGSLTSLHEFLEAVEAAKPKLKVERLTLSTGQKDPSRVEGQMVISSYSVAARKGSSG